MVTAHPLPEGFTEIEVFAIGTALLVEGKFGVGPRQQEDFFSPIISCKKGGRKIEVNSSICGMPTLVTVATSPVLLGSKSGWAASSLLWRSALYA